ncbi:hypothetical protein V496_03606, partial [Pseudogymnoascus sp. VKM F-4515 (FW-2607)]
VALPHRDRRRKRRLHELRSPDRRVPNLHLQRAHPRHLRGVGEHHVAGPLRRRGREAGAACDGGGEGGAAPGEREEGAGGADVGSAGARGLSGAGEGGAVRGRER